MASNVNADVITRALVRFEPVVMYLFRSVAAGRLHPASDVDVVSNKTAVIERCLRRVAEDYQGQPSREDGWLLGQLM